MMKRHVPVIATLLSLACGHDSTSPSSNPQPPTGAPLTMRGEVWDTTNLPISGAQVQSGAPRYPVSIGFELEAIDTPIIVAGIYEMTFTAAGECTQLPAVVRQRTYRAQVYPNGLGRFSSMVFDIEPRYNTVFDSDVHGEPAQSLRVQVVTDPSASPAIGIVERIERDTFCEITGSTEIPLGARSGRGVRRGVRLLPGRSGCYI